MHNYLVRGVLFLSLGLDTLGVAIGLGLSGLSGGRRIRVGLSFALAEGIMPLAGFLAGSKLANAVGDAASYVAIIVLLLLGAYSVREAMREEEPEYLLDSTLRLVLLSLSVSLDELAVGFSLGLFQVPILLAAAFIAVQAFAVTIVGTAAGHWMSRAAPGRAELLSGLALTALAIFLLMEKLTGLTI